MRLARARSGNPMASSPSPLSPRGALALAAWFGLAAGYLDLCGIILAKHWLHTSVFYQQGRYVFWAVPVAHLTIMMVPGLLAAGLNRLRAGLVSLRAAAWLFATLAIWGPLLNLPLSGRASLLLAAGSGRLISRGVAGLGPRGRRLARRSLAGLAGLLVVTAAGTIGGRAVAEYRASARLPAPPSRAANVLLIVMDTVRARSLSLYGYSRDTTPQLARWAKRGVRFEWASSPSSWTFPSHCTLFTGRWPYQLNSHRHLVLDAPCPTLAEFLGEQGYRTAGFAANTSYCSYESGLDRGFAHYEDYTLSPWTILATTAPGRWLAMNVLMDAMSPDDFYGRKWLQYRSRDARGINAAFLDWLSRQSRGDRPFFAFLNFMDAHEPFLSPRGQAAKFGVPPMSRGDYEILLHHWDTDKTHISARDVALNRDGYDNCIAYLDEQLGALLDELDRRGVLENTLVVITSDHGEEFGEHNVFNHGYSLYLDETRVPLVILSGAAPAGRVVDEPVSLRDVPATIIDLLGMTADSPFPGGSLAAHWRSEAGAARPPDSPALAEADFLTIALDPRRGRGPTQRGYTMSLMTKGWHYIRDGAGAEGLFDLATDPGESFNLLRTSRDFSALLGGFRQALFQALTQDPVASGTEEDYLKRYRSKLQAIIQARTRSDDPITTEPATTPEPGRL
jgi:arylsulfatase A-like enzyme